MAFTDRQRERAFEMFADGVPTSKVASSLRLPANSVRSLRAHWTMGNISSSTSSSSRNSGSVQSYRLTLSQAKQVADAYYDGIDNPTIRLNSNRIST